MKMTSAQTARLAYTLLGLYLLSLIATCVLLMNR
jgi:hypothetical protein